MRRQHYSVPVGGGLRDAWDVHRLVRLAEGLPVVDVRLAELPEVEEPAWSEGAPLTLRQIAYHMRLVREVDPRHPVLLTAEGRIMDGRHRVVRAILEGRETIPAVRFEPTPEPDARGVTMRDLGYG
jgi:hypothetical protein